VFKEFKVKLEQLVHKVKLEQQDQLVQPELIQQFQVQQDQLDLQEQQDQLDHKEMHQQFLDQRDQLVQLDLAERKVFKVRPEQPVLLDLQDQQELMVVLQTTMITLRILH
jgi:hypothetical protein